MLKVEIKKQYKDFLLDVAFEASTGLTMILGPSGAGKSTILNCIAGVVTPQEGKISIEDTLYYDSKTSFKLPVHKRRVGYVFQSYALFPHIKVIKNIEYGLKNYELEGRRDRIRYYVDNFKINHLVHKYPHQLSGGERQRVALIRALIIEPRVLLLDEPFSALDCRTKKTLYDEFLLIKEKWNIPMLMITHNEKEAHYLGDRIIRIEGGRIFDEASL